MSTKEKQVLKKLRRKQLNQLYRILSPLKKTKLPSGSWLNDVREALGITATQLAERLGVKRQVLNGIEKSEASGSIMLKTLRRAAEAMDCEVIYLVVPRNQERSLDSLLEQRARVVAKEIIRKVSHTMALEDQEVSEQEQERQIRETADELVRTLDKRLWER